MSKATGSGFRADIQGLRAIAVLVVLVFHVWPGLLPGGYVGVDVFFVISGYLITGLLVREFERSGTISLRDFYARRIRRLLPAASATLLAVALCGWWLASVSEWSGLARELVASALYVENWLLVGRSVDYLAQDAAPSALQHYWSLSVEEQFYIIWPLLMLGTGWLARRSGLGVRGVFLSALSVVTLASLGYGIYVSYVDPAPGYFLTTTRVWELGIGGLLALTASRYVPGRGLGGVLGWGGMVAIGVSAWFYSSRLPFPGYEALLPTLGAGALLFARVGGESVLGRCLGTRPMQYVGDISYSLYLWHWPVVVFYGPATGREVSTLQDGMLVVVVSFVLAHASKVLLEERYRHGRPGETFRPYAIALCLTAAVTAAAIGLSAVGNARIQASLPVPGPRTEIDPLHPGALAWDRPDSVPGAPVVPAPDVARIDRQLRPGANERCIAPIEGSEVTRCVFGNADSSYRVVLVGDSHAEHWIPAFAALAGRSGWRLEVIAKSGCALIDADIVSGSSRTASRLTRRAGSGERACRGNCRRSPPGFWSSPSPPPIE